MGSPPRSAGGDDDEFDDEGEGGAAAEAEEPTGPRTPGEFFTDAFQRLVIGVTVVGRGLRNGFATGYEALKEGVYPLKEHAVQSYDSVSTKCCYPRTPHEGGELPAAAAASFHGPEEENRLTSQKKASNLSVMTGSATISMDDGSEAVATVANSRARRARGVLATWNVNGLRAAMRRRRAESPRSPRVDGQSSQLSQFLTEIADSNEIACNAEEKANAVEHAQYAEWQNAECQNSGAQALELQDAALAQIAVKATEKASRGGSTTREFAFEAAARTPGSVPAAAGDNALNPSPSPASAAPVPPSRPASAPAPLTPAIVCLQEIKCTRRDLSFSMCRIPGWEAYYSLATPGTAGVPAASGTRYSGVGTFARAGVARPVDARENLRWAVDRVLRRFSVERGQDKGGAPFSADRQPAASSPTDLQRLLKGYMAFALLGEESAVREIFTRNGENAARAETAGDEALGENSEFCDRSAKTLVTASRVGSCPPGAGDASAGSASAGSASAGSASGGSASAGSAGVGFAGSAGSAGTGSAGVGFAGSAAESSASLLAALSALRRDATSLDQEGRCVITHHGGFALFNVYCPAVRLTRENLIDVSRLRAKMAFHTLVWVAAREVAAYSTAARLPGGEEKFSSPGEGVGEGEREVAGAGPRTAGVETSAAGVEDGRRNSTLPLIIVGDFNVTLTAKDTCDPVSWYESAWRQPFISVIEDMMCDLRLADAFRARHPTATGRYTCWNQVTGARVNNLGTRIDLVLASQDLLAAGPWDCAQREDFEGSDHCPVVFAAGALADRLASASKPPPLCAIYFSQANRRQMGLGESNLFSRADGGGSGGGSQDSLVGLRQRRGARLYVVLLHEGSKTSVPAIREVREVTFRLGSSVEGETKFAADGTAAVFSFDMRCTVQMNEACALDVYLQLHETREVDTLIEAAADCTCGFLWRAVLPNWADRIDDLSRNDSSATSPVCPASAHTSALLFRQIAEQGGGCGRGCMLLTYARPEEVAASFARGCARTYAVKSTGAGFSLQRVFSGAAHSQRQAEAAEPSSELASRATCRCRTGQEFAVEDLLRVASYLSRAEQEKYVREVPYAPLCRGHLLPCIRRRVKKSGPSLGRELWMCAMPQGARGSDRAHSRCGEIQWASKGARASGGGLGEFLVKKAEGN